MAPSRLGVRRSAILRLFIASSTDRARQRRQAAAWRSETETRGTGVNGWLNRPDRLPVVRGDMIGAKGGTRTRRESAVCGCSRGGRREGEARPEREGSGVQPPAESAGSPRAQRASHPHAYVDGWWSIRELVRKGGLEPPRPCGHKILNLIRHQFQISCTCCKCSANICKVL